MPLKTKLNQLTCKGVPVNLVAEMLAEALNSKGIKPPRTEKYTFAGTRNVLYGAYDDSQVVAELDELIKTGAAEAEYKRRKELRAAARMYPARNRKPELAAV